MGGVMVGLASDLFELTKPRLTGLILATAAFGFVLASEPGQIAWDSLALLVAGMGMTAGGGGALNHYLERDRDALMARTQARPLPASRLGADAALWFGVLTALAGQFLILACHGAPTGLLASLGLFIYIFVYTPLKIRSPWNTFVGAITGALPPLVGWSAASQGTLGPQAWGLFAVLFAWQMPHFYSLSYLCREDYSRAGFRMSGLEGQGLARGPILVYVLLLIPASLLPYKQSLAGPVYALGASLLGLVFLGLCLVLVLKPDPRSGLRVFLSSLYYLPVLFLLMLWDRVHHP